MIPVVADGIDELLISLFVTAIRDGERLAACLRPERRRIHVRQWALAGAALS
jgi:hypothetical protein